MDIILDETTLRDIEHTRLPRYQEIPDVGLYLNQAVKYINDIIYPLLQTTVTETMVSNYVKMHLVPSPVKKRYGREQICHLLFIAMGKTILSLDNIHLMLQMQLATHETREAYTYFCREFENQVRLSFGLEPLTPELNQEGGDEKRLLRRMIAALAQKIYLEHCFRHLRTENGAE